MSGVFLPYFEGFNTYAIWPGQDTVSKCYIPVLNICQQIYVKFRLQFDLKTSIHHIRRQVAMASCLPVQLLPQWPRVGGLHCHYTATADMLPTPQGIVRK